ncbi:glutathionylspermidine synthase family protein [Heliobacterium chlorum]|uniref:Glutathionylspermidine synthase family protein n=1 Tax=Heliobacterium chlorum TaxID=2698 RepID=A0ABR7T0X3_HELCL|nr:glutathionylspermidine synthase family protein [Heliobacterium chlorum]MBC9783638.1 glutathionylspermidine synthase family protein [Heliobacterium chlorum]
MQLSAILPDDREAYLDRWEEDVARYEETFGFTWAFDGRGQHFYNLHALVMSTEEHRRFLSAHRQVVDLLHTVQVVIEGHPDLLDFLGIPKSLQAHCLRQRLPWLTALGRFDWYWTDQGPKLLEFNSETPFGLVESCLLQPQVARTYHRTLSDPNELLEETLRRSLRDSFVRQGGQAGTVTAIVGFPSDPEERSTLRFVENLAAYEPGKVLIGDVRDLSIDSTGRLCAGNFPVDFLQSFYSVEWYARDQGGPQFIDCMEKGQLCLINPPSTLLLHSKALLALLWLVKPKLSPPRQEAIEQYIPYTSLDPDLMQGRPVMIKPLHNREGLGIIDCDALTMTDLPQGDVVYQARVDAEPVFFPVMRNGRIRKRPLLPTIGTFCLFDELAGFYTRLSPKIVTAQEACWVPTLVQPD